MLRQEQSLERHAGGAAAGSQRHQPRSRAPEVQEHRLGREARARNASTGGNTVRGGCGGYGEGEPVL